MARLIAWPEVGSFWQGLEVGEAGRLRHVHDAPGLIVGLTHLTAPGRLARQFLLHLGEAHVGVAEEDQAQNGEAVLGGGQGGVGSELVSGLPQTVFKFS